ncbi:MAG: peptide-methionine (S)-S-oxide reductase MsrA [Hyphomicrobiaceae bacterium]
MTSATAERGRRRWMVAIAVSAVAIVSALIAIPGGDTAAAADKAAEPAGSAVAIFASGCFWCTESDFDKVAGVLSTTSGYIGGRTENPTYDSVSSGRTGHTEALRVVFDPAKVSYETLLAHFWRNVDAVDGGGQFCDRGSQYRPGIFVTSPEQRRLAEASKAALEKSGRFGKPIAVEITDATRFYDAEDYHQDYHQKNPLRYKIYRHGCGRDQRLQQIWGSDKAS